MKRIAVLINSRVEGNLNFGLINLLKSMIENSKDLDQIEVLVKFDSCDPWAGDIISQIMRMPISIKYIIEPRGRGYIDIHHGYNRLLMHIDPQVYLIGAMADDFLVEKGWDEAMIKLIPSPIYQDLYIIHQRPHPPTSRVNYGSKMFNMDYPMFDKLEDLYIVDEAPFWSRELLFTTSWLGGGLSFTDGWTLALEYVLWHKYGLKITLFTDKLRIKRITHPGIDTSNNPRWNTDRKENFEYIKTKYFRDIVEHQARNVYLTIKERCA